MQPPRQLLAQSGQSDPLSLMSASDPELTFGAAYPPSLLSTVTGCDSRVGRLDERRAKSRALKYQPAKGVANQLTCPAPQRGKTRPREPRFIRGARAMPSYGANLVIDRASRLETRAEQSWRAWYKSPTWKAIKRHRLIQEPNCRHCAQEGRAVIAKHVDHVEPHRGQWSRFTKYENTQSLCARHHNSHRQRQ